VVGARDLRERAHEALGLSAVHARDPDRAAAFADEALRLAEELEDPVLLAEALGARLTTRAGPDDLDARLGTSLRLLGLVRQLPDPDVRLEAHLWRLTTAMEQLDLGTVRRQLAALDLLADETQDDRHRFFACARRAMFALTEGDAVGAARLAAEAADAGDDVDGADEMLRSLHAELARQRGERTALVQHASQCEERGQARDTAPLLAQASVLWLEGGEPERARRLVDEIAPALGDLPLDADWLFVVSKVCEAAVGSGRVRTAARCADLLTPYAGRGVLDARAVAFAGVVEDYLALATRDREQASRARAAYRRLGADWWARRGPLGRTHEPATGAEAGRVLHLHPVEPDSLASMWCVGREGAERTMPGMPGLEHLRQLLDQPGVDVPVLDLSGMTQSAGEGSGTPVDQQAVVERARSTVRRAIRTALARLELHDGEVAYELRTTIRTGASCRYEPDRFRPVEWRLHSEQHATQAVGEP
jgi:hypothetical protein